MPSIFRKRKGQVLAVKWGLNPNSSSLGVDVTFLLLGSTALAMATPIVSAMIRLKLSRAKKSKMITQLQPQAKPQGE